MAVFGSFGMDAGIAFLLGLLGGLAAELIVHKGGIEIPHAGDDENEKYLLNAGFVSNLILGAVAALAFFFVLDTSDPYKFVGATIGAGVGGSAVLIAVKEKLIGTIAQNNADNTVKEAVSNLKIIQAQNQAPGTMVAGTKSADIDTMISNLEKRSSKAQKP
jgi:hypothetical protein